MKNLIHLSFMKSKTNELYEHIFISEKINKELKLIKFDSPVLFYRNNNTGELYTKDTIKYILGGEITVLYTYDQVLNWFEKKGYYYGFSYMKYRSNYMYSYEIFKNGEYIKNNYKKRFFNTTTELKEQLVLYLIELVFNNGE